MSTKPKATKAAKATKPQIKVQDIKPKKDAKGGAKRGSSVVPCI